MDTLKGLKLQKVALCSGFFFLAFIGIGWLGVGHFIMPAHADLTLEETLQYFTVDYQWQNIWGNTCLIIASAFLCPTSVMMGLLFSDVEGRHPVWSICVAVGGLGIALIIFLNGCAWMTCAYRPWPEGDVVQSWSDWAWLAFLRGWVVLELEMVAATIVSMNYKNRVIPRWFSYASMVGMLVLMGAQGIAFFQSGPFAYHGLAGFYLPMAVWGLWFVGETVFWLKEVGRRKAELLAAHPELAVEEDDDDED